MAPLVGIIVFMGVYPKPMLDRIQPSVDKLITHVENNTYIAELHLERNGTIARVDTRPSDAIAIAVRTESPIFAAENLLATPDEDDDEDSDTATFGPPTVVDQGSELTAEQLKAYLEHLRPEDFGKFNL